MGFIGTCAGFLGRFNCFLVFNAANSQQRAGQCVVTVLRSFAGIHLERLMYALKTPHTTG